MKITIISCRLFPSWLSTSRLLSKAIACGSASTRPGPLQSWTCCCAPASALPALHVEEVRHGMSNVITTRVFNLLDMPAGVVTVSQVKREDLLEIYDPGTQREEITQASLGSRSERGLAWI